MMLRNMAVISQNINKKNEKKRKDKRSKKYLLLGEFIIICNSVQIVFQMKQTIENWKNRLQFTRLASCQPIAYQTQRKCSKS